MESLLPIFIYVIFGTICALLARHKGRSAIGWFFIGALFTLLGLIIILCLSNKKDEQTKYDQMQNEQRRLHEQLRQERMKNEQFRKHTQTRLDVHDQSLGIETRDASSAMLTTGDVEMLDDIDQLEELEPPRQEEYYGGDVKGEDQQGPSITDVPDLGTTPDYTNKEYWPDK